jgi:alkyl hydroperoxide reductase subunit AhpC
MKDMAQMKRRLILGSVATLGLAALVAFLLLDPAIGATPAIQPVAPGRPLPDLDDLKKVNGDAGPPAAEFLDFSLKDYASGKYLLLFYWMVGDSGSEDNLKSVARWAAEKDDVRLVGIVPPRGGGGVAVAERARTLGLEIPIIWDEGYRMQRTIRAATVPYITVVDPGRIVRVMGAYNLKHKIIGDITLARYLETALNGGGHPTVSQVPRHYPVTELINEPFIDFTLNTLSENKLFRFSDHVGDGKLTLLIFWSADCGHCKTELPELDNFYRRHGDSLDMVGIVKVPNDAIKKRTTDFLDAHKISFPTVVDRSHKVFSEYRVRTTPTTVVVNPQGRVESVLIGAAVDLNQELGTLIDKLKKSRSEGA